jgi:hypothetical protein
MENVHKRTQSAVQVGNIMREALKGIESNGIRVNDRNISNLQFENDISLISELISQVQPHLDRADHKLEI